MTNIVDIIGDVVSKVSAELVPVQVTGQPHKASLADYDNNIVNVNYLHGPPLEMVNILTDWTKTREADKQKYPIVMLYEPIRKSESKTIDGFNPHLIIARRNSDPKLKAPQRYLNNFNPVLTPVLESFLKFLCQDPRVPTNGYVDYTADYWPYWGGVEQQDKNPFNDKLDIIEVRINNLIIDDLTC